MYSNLKKAINNIDEDLNQCTLRYEKVKEVITSEITEYIKNLINPIAEENKKLKEELKTANTQIQEENNQLTENLAAAYTKIEELKTLLLDSNTQCKNAVKETKQWINREIEETNLNLRTTQYEMRKNEIQEKINRMNKRRENNSKPSYINDKNIENNTQAPKTSTAASNRNTTEVIQGENKLQTGSQPIENKTGNIFIIMDSNRKFISFEKFFAEELFGQNASIITIPCGIINKTRNISKSHDISYPSKILLHVGINDIDNQQPEDIAYKLKLLAEEHKEKFKCEVFLSDIKPREGQYHQDVELINHNLNSLLRNSNIIRVKHSNIKSQHLHDDKHLKRNESQGEEMSGVQLFCKNIYETMTQKTIEMELI